MDDSYDLGSLPPRMTLFLRAMPGEPAFGQALSQHFDGVPDAATDRILGE